MTNFALRAREARTGSRKADPYPMVGFLLELGTKVFQAQNTFTSAVHLSYAPIVVFYHLASFNISSRTTHARRKSVVATGRTEATRDQQMS